MDDLKAKYLGQIAEAGDENTLEAIRVAAVGKKRRGRAENARVGQDDPRGTPRRRAGVERP